MFKCSVGLPCDVAALTAVVRTHMTCDLRAIQKAHPEVGLKDTYKCTAAKTAVPAWLTRCWGLGVCDCTCSIVALLPTCFSQEGMAISKTSVLFLLKLGSTAR